MARRRKNSKNKYKKKNKQSLNAAILGTIIFSVLLAVLLYANSGSIGIKLNEFLGGLIGILRFILPVGSFIIAIKIAYQDEENYITKQLVQYTILIICVAIIMSIYEISSGAIETSGNISMILKKAYTLGAANRGGGIIGTLAAVVLTRFLGRMGAVVLSIGIAVMLFIFVCGIDIAQIIEHIIETIILKKEERKIEKTERIRQREEYMAMRREELIAKRQKKMQEKEEFNKALIKENNAKEIEPEQIRINLNGRIIDDEQANSKSGLKSLLGMKPSEKKNIKVNKDTGEIIEPDNSLFVQEEEEKQDKTKQVLNLEHTITIEEENYEFPPLEILKQINKTSLKGGTEKLKNTAAKLQKTLYSFGVQAKVENVTVGPAITRYELKPAEGVRVSKIANLADDIALNLAAETIRIEAPIPGKQAVGIEIPNKEKEMVGLRQVIESENFKNNNSKLSVALRKRCCRRSGCCKYCKNATRAYCW